MRQQDKLVHENKDGSGLARHMLQMMEQFVKFAKKQCRRNCNHKVNWMKRTFEYLDCVTLGSIGYDLVDFKSCKTEYEKHRNLIYDKDATPQMEQQILSEMPEYWFSKWQQVRGVQFRDKITPDMQKEWNQHLHDAQYNEMCHDDDNTHVNYMNMDGIDEIDENSSESSGFDTGMRNLSVEQLSQRMMHQTQEQSQQS